MLAELEAHHLNTPARSGTIRKPRMVQASLFAGTDDAVLEAIRALDVDTMTPDQVVERVRAWKRDLKGK